jgi:type IV conjugative transfer system protein TraL
LSQDHTDYFFPRFIDRPRLIGIFEIDEFFLAFFLMTAILALSLALPNLGSLTVMVSAIVTGVGSAVAYSKFKKGRPDGFTIQKLYRAGFYSPGDDKKALILNPYLRKMGNVIPYGFTKELFS